MSRILQTAVFAVVLWICDVWAIATDADPSPVDMGGMTWDDTE